MQQTGPINMLRHLNSGFYFARSNSLTIAAVKKVVTHAATPDLSEQPIFYDLATAWGRWIKSTMLMGCYGGLLNRQGNSRRKQELTRASVSLGYSKDTSVRIVHPGGRQELFESAVPAREIMDKYPGTCIAKPGVFKNPEESLLQGEEKMMPGNKYLVIPSTTAEKLRHRLSRTKNSKEANDDDSDDTSNVSIAWDVHVTCKESVCSAKDFYASNDRLRVQSERKNVRYRQKPFVPPFPMLRILKGLSWEPSLTSVQELSP
ncbi:Beta-arabinofuranosyltransferase RAY1 [Linum perenne]